MPRDQVYEVNLNEKKAKFNMAHEDEIYYFCSVKCKKDSKRTETNS